MQERSVFVAECLCGRGFETPVCEYFCPAYNRHIVLDWGRDLDQEPDTSIDDVSVPEAAA